MLDTTYLIAKHVSTLKLFEHISQQSFFTKTYSNKNNFKSEHMKDRFERVRMQVTMLAVEKHTFVMQ